MDQRNGKPTLHAPPDGRPQSFLYFHPYEFAARVPKGHVQNLRPRDAAALLVYDLSGSQPRVLMGLRHFAHKFMPDKFVFPGGRVEPQDYKAAVSSRPPLAEAIAIKLLRHIRGAPRAQRAFALVHAALRETREETGLTINADMGDLSLIARAITPPRRPKRFDTRFFAISAQRITGEPEAGDGEFTSIHWLTFDEAHAQDLPVITRAVLDDFAARLINRSLLDPAAAVPFYFMRGACFHRRRL